MRMCTSKEARMQAVAAIQIDDQARWKSPAPGAFATPNDDRLAAILVPRGLHLPTHMPGFSPVTSQRSVALHCFNLKRGKVWHSLALKPGMTLSLQRAM